MAANSNYLEHAVYASEREREREEIKYVLQHKQTEKIT